MKKDIIKNLTSQLVKGKGIEEIRSTLDSQNRPKSIAFRGNRKSYTPELIAVYDNRMDYYAVEDNIKKKELPDLISKWILFGLEARNKRGRFYIVTTKKFSDQVKEIIDQKQLSAELKTV